MYFLYLLFLLEDRFFSCIEFFAGFFGKLPKVNRAIIGGSGLARLEGAKEIEKISRLRLATPYGLPTSDIIIYEVEDVQFAFLNRHGSGHVFSPRNVNYRANFYALKKLGVTEVIGVSACGSIVDDIAVAQLTVPDDISDLTKSHAPTLFWGKGCVVHTSMANPFSEKLRQLIRSAFEKTLEEGQYKMGATYGTVVSPWFSSAADSRQYYKSGVHLLGMTTVPEVRAARETEVEFAVICVPTDKDVGGEHEEPVTATAVVEAFTKAIPLVQKVVLQVVKMPSTRKSNELEGVIIGGLQSDIDMVPGRWRRRISFLTGKSWRQIQAIKKAA